MGKQNRMALGARVGLCCQPPVHFCQSDCAAAVSSTKVAGVRGALEQCLICRQQWPKYVAVGRCGHADVCWICSLRLRALLHDFKCPMCKEELPEIVFSEDVVSAQRKAATLHTKDEKRHVSKFGIVHTSDSLADTERLFDYTCWLPDCPDSGRCFTTLDGLSQHVASEHGLSFCKTCLYGRKAFLREQLLYDPKDLDRHTLEGDSAELLGWDEPPIPAHARCEFCKKTFYSQEELFGHMQRRHHTCKLCDRRGRRNEYYKDYGYLSQHYSEQHYVCSHPDCRHDSYQLVVFENEDELRLHDASEHQAEVKGPRGTRKQAVRLNLQIGTRSYREEQQVRENQRPREPPPVPNGEAACPVRFMWTRGRPPRAPDYARSQDLMGDQDEEQEERYPPRRVSRFAGRSRIGPQVGVKHDSAPDSDRSQRRTNQTLDGLSPVKEQSLEDQEKTVATVPKQSTACILLSAAVAAIDERGIDISSTLDAEGYRMWNRKFRVDLQVSLGSEASATFKDHSTKFQRSLSQAKDANESQRAAPLRTYAHSVLEVFVAACEHSGTQKMAYQMRDLVLLLPDAALRQKLLEELRRLRDLNLTESQPRSSLAAQELTPLPAQAETLPLAAAFRGVGEDQSVCFLSALGQLSSAVADGPIRGAPGRALRLQAQVEKLSTQQAESLDQMRFDICAAGGGDLDPSVTERLLALRPLLSLKVRPGADLPSAQQRQWREWKVVATSVVTALSREQLGWVQRYIATCLRKLAESGGAEAPAKDASGTRRSHGQRHVLEESAGSSLPPVVSRGVAPEAPDAGMDFPSLPSTAHLEEGTREEAKNQEAASAGRNKKKGGRQRQVLVAWG